MIIIISSIITVKLRIIKNKCKKHKLGGFMKKKDIILDIVKITVVLGIVVFAAINFDKLSNIDVRVLIAGASSVLVAELIIMGVYLVKAITLVVPASMIYISVGMAFDWKRATIINLIGIAIEVTATYFLGKFLGKSAVENKLKGTKAGDKLLNMQEKNQNTAMFLIRFIPAFPIDFSFLFMGAFGFRFPQYLLFSMLGIAPRVIAFTILGDSIYDLIPMKYIILAAIIILPIAVIVAVVKSRAGKKKE